jgi:hypothetical protein
VLSLATVEHDVGVSDDARLDLVEGARSRVAMRVGRCCEQRATRGLYEFHDDFMVWASKADRSIRGAEVLGYGIGRLDHER